MWTTIAIIGTISPSEGSDHYLSGGRMVTGMIGAVVGTAAAWTLAENLIE